MLDSFFFEATAQDRQECCLLIGSVLEKAILCSRGRQASPVTMAAIPTALVHTHLCHIIIGSHRRNSNS